MEGDTDMTMLYSGTSSSKKSGDNMRPKRCRERDCQFVTYNIDEYWQHKFNTHKDLYSYICPYESCKFVTKYKHHMTHHELSKHENVKRFECGYCNYKCVSKSMLASHQKSHWDYYPYQCGSCLYKSKFVNTYKKHLRDHNHEPGIVLNRNGVPDPSIVIDVYGSRRGPRQTATATSICEQQSPSCSERLQPVCDSPTTLDTIQTSSNSIFSMLAYRRMSEMAKIIREIYERKTKAGEFQRQREVEFFFNVLIVVSVYM